LYNFLTQSRRERIMQRNTVENYSEAFDWKNLIKHYRHAYELAVPSHS
jgi:glycogen(starch) synthase